MRTKHFAIATLVAASAASMAQENTIKLGVSNVQPNSSVSDFSGPFTPPGLSAKVLDKKTLFFSYTREVQPHWAVEFAFGAPPTHDIALKINNAFLPASVQGLSGVKGAEIRQIAPTLFVNYKFLEKASAWQPFVGAGVNYTRFDNTKTTAAGDALFGGPTSLRTQDSVGLALQTGVNYHLDNHWSLSAILGTANVKTRITSNTMGIERTAEVKFRPTVFTVAAGYSF